MEPIVSIAVFTSFILGALIAFIVSGTYFRKRKSGVANPAASHLNNSTPPHHSQADKSASCASSSVPTWSWKYDVFISFRGEDTRYAFVDHLYAALVQRGLCVFKDDEELKKGKAISPELMKAIEESRCVVVVFSKNYTDSSWCLAELAKIMEWHNRMGQKVIPVFYHVDPSDIRRQENDVAVFFKQHEKRFREEKDKVKEWREALTAAASLSGEHILETFKKGESTYIEKIIEEILGDMQPSDIQANLVGMDSHMNAIISLLKLEEKEEVRMIGIYGMGGIGKTTIAKALYRKIAYKFEGSSFVNDVRENSFSKRDTCALQEKVLKNILRTNYNFNVQDPEDGANMMRSRFVHKKVLIVLDDVDNSKQLEFLAAAHDSFGSGSRIIITTRNEQLLSDANGKYRPDCMPQDEALELFSRHAFKSNGPSKGYEELSRRAIHLAGYLPLALEVLGSFFHGRKAVVWESALDRLAKAPNKEIFDTLKLSFDGLEVSEKKIFLDIACFFKGKYVQDAARVLESCGFDPLIGISVLIEKSLITISCYNVLNMHDLIQEMGWQIVRESFPNSRLWKPGDIHDSLTNKRKRKAIEAIKVSDEQNDAEEYEAKVGFGANVFKGMKSLRLLDIRGRFTSNEPTVFPHNLRWLCWSEYPFSSIQLSQMSKLVHLQISGSVKQLWNGRQIMPNLKILKLEELDCLTTLPDVSVAPNIEELELSNCMNLVEVHESLGSHKRISELSIIGCGQLKRLPCMIMPKLKSLELGKLDRLTTFPNVSGAPNIRSLVMYHCMNLVEVHESLGSRKRIYWLSITDCEQLKRLPSRFEMEFLEYLYLSGCSSLERLPDVSPCMVNLLHIDLDACSSIEGLPSSFGYLSSLQNLTFRCDESLNTINNPEEHRRKALESLPKLIGLHALMNFCSLATLTLSGRQIEIEDFPNLHDAFPSLEVLDLCGNNKLMQLPASISQLSCLKKLYLNKCCQLQILHGLPSKIEKLEANDCCSLEKIEDLSKVSHQWNHISFHNCDKLVKDEDSKRSLFKMLHHLLFMRCAAVGGLVEIVIPGNKIPRWFKEEQRGERLRLMMPPKCNARFIGIVTCAVTSKTEGKWFGSLKIDIVKDEEESISEEEEDEEWYISEKEEAADCINAYEDGNALLIAYTPSYCGESLSDRRTSFSISSDGCGEVVRCAGGLIYKEEYINIIQLDSPRSLPSYKQVADLLMPLTTSQRIANL